MSDPAAEAKAAAAAAAKAEKEARKLQFAAANPALANKADKSKPAAAAPSPPAASAPSPAASSASAPAAAATAAPAPVKVLAYALPEPLSQLRQASVIPPFGGAAPTASPHVAASLLNDDHTQSTHPRVAALGALLTSRCIVGGNARLLAMLDALCLAACSYVESHAVSGGMRVLQNLSAHLKYNVQHLESCRPFSNGMQQVVTRIMRQLETLRELSAKAIYAMFQELRNELLDAVAYTASGVASCIQEGDVVVTYGRSSAIEMALCSLCERNHTIAEANRIRQRKLALQQEAAASGMSNQPSASEHHHEMSVATPVNSMPPHSMTSVMAGAAAGTSQQSCSPRTVLNFSVVVVDSAPLFEGRALLRKLREAGAPSVTYCLLDACVMAVHRSTKVFIGASAMMPNGQVLGRAGTAMVAMAAKYCRKPVFAVSESYKFTAHLSSSILSGATTMLGGAAPYRSGSPQTAAAKAAEQQRKSNSMMYDLTAPGTVNFVVSEHEVHDPTAIAAVVKMQLNN